MVLMNHSLLKLAIGGRNPGPGPDRISVDGGFRGSSGGVLIAEYREQHQHGILEDQFDYGRRRRKHEAGRQSARPRKECVKLRAASLVSCPIDL